MRAELIIVIVKYMFKWHIFSGCDSRKVEWRWIHLVSFVVSDRSAEWQGYTVKPGYSRFRVYQTQIYRIVGYIEQLKKSPWRTCVEVKGTCSGISYYHMPTNSIYRTLCHACAEKNGLNRFREAECVFGDSMLWIVWDMFSSIQEVLCDCTGNMIYWKYCFQVYNWAMCFICLAC